MTDERLVVDASVVVTLLIGPGAQGEVFAKRLDSAQAHAPAPLPVEVTNALRRLRNKGRLSESEALLALRGFWSLPIELWPQETISARTWELGQNLTAYDAAYIAIAEVIGGPLLTADVRLSRAPGAKCAVEVFA